LVSDSPVRRTPAGTPTVRPLPSDPLGPMPCPGGVRIVAKHSAAKVNASRVEYVQRDFIADDFRDDGRTVSACRVLSTRGSERDVVNDSSDTWLLI